MFLQIQFKCNSSVCPCRDWTKLTVLSRDEKQDIMSWMLYVRQEVSNRHATLAPGCPRRTCDLAIPLGSKERGTEAERIGGPTADDDELKPL